MSIDVLKVKRTGFELFSAGRVTYPPFVRALYDFPSLRSGDLVAL